MRRARFRLRDGLGEAGLAAIEVAPALRRREAEHGGEIAALE